MPPKKFVQTVRRLCDEHGILLIADEIITGFGRTGNWFGMDEYDVVPDIMVVGKGLGERLSDFGYDNVGGGRGRVGADDAHEHFFGQPGGLCGGAGIAG